LSAKFDGLGAKFDGLNARFDGLTRSLPTIVGEVVREVLRAGRPVELIPSPSSCRHAVKPAQTA